MQLRLSVLFILLLALGAGLAWQFYWKTPGFLDFWCHRGDYQKIVAVIKSRPLPPAGMTAHETLSGIEVYSENVQNSYVITPVTANWGHLGKAGYVYSENPLNPISG